MKHFLIVTRDANELQRYYQFVVDSCYEIATRYYCNNRNHGRVDTKGFTVDIILENYYPIMDMRLTNFIYTGSDKEYKDLLKSLVVRE